MTATEDAIRARQRARRERAIARIQASKVSFRIEEKPKRAKKEKPVEELVEEPVVLTEADSLADLNGEPRPDNPTVEAEPDGEQEETPVQDEEDEEEVEPA